MCRNIEKCQEKTTMQLQIGRNEMSILDMQDFTKMVCIGNYMLHHVHGLNRFNFNTPFPHFFLINHFKEFKAKAYSLLICYQVHFAE